MCLEQPRRASERFREASSSEVDPRGVAQGRWLSLLGVCRN
jgi:hypothetical protein